MSEIPSGMAEIILAALSAVSAVLAFLFSLLAEGTKRQGSKRREAIQPVDKDQLELQIRDIDDYLKRQERLAWTNGVLALLLNASQYGVGAALVTTLVTENVSTQIAGALGAITLLSSFMLQLVKPSIRKRQADERIVLLRALRRRAELALAEIRLAESRGHPAQDDLRFASARAFLDELHAIQREEARQ